MSSLKEIEAFWEKVCFDPNYQPEGRYQTYRELVFSGMLDVLQSICPVARGILSDGDWQQVLQEFLREAPPRSVVIRQLPFEASQYLKDHDHVLSETYPWLGELMEYEYLEVGVRFAPEVQVTGPKDSLSLNPAHALGAYTWPVHFISETRHDPDKLPRAEYFLFLWREPESLEVKFMEINPLVAAVFRHLQNGPLNEISLLQQVADEMEIEPGTEYLEEGKALLKGLADKGIVFKN